MPDSATHPLLDWATRVVETNFAVDDGRHRHLAACLAKARSWLSVVPGDEDLALAAITLHDIGFAKPSYSTGFSTLDGALYIRELGAPQRLVDLIAHQFVGTVEARYRGLDERYGEFGPDEGTAVRDLMWSCCLTTDPDGSETTVQERCDGWARYDVDWLPEYLKEAQDDLQAAVDRTLVRLRSQPTDRIAWSDAETMKVPPKLR